jgi:hypothetical protein
LFFTFGKQFTKVIEQNHRLCFYPINYKKAPPEDSFPVSYYECPGEEFYVLSEKFHFPGVERCLVILLCNILIKVLLLPKQHRNFRFEKRKLGFEKMKLGTEESKLGFEHIFVTFEVRKFQMDETYVHFLHRKLGMDET